MRQNMGAGFGKCLGQGKDKNGEQQQAVDKQCINYKMQAINPQAFSYTVHKS